MDESTEFRGFTGEKLTLVKQDGGHGHDHLILEYKGKEIGYFHITSKDIDFYVIGNVSAQTITFGKL